MKMEIAKSTYEVPTLTVLGALENMTQATNLGAKADGQFNHTEEVS